jgi:hypothetical protein
LPGRKRASDTKQSRRIPPSILPPFTEALERTRNSKPLRYSRLAAATSPAPAPAQLQVPEPRDFGSEPGSEPEARLSIRPLLVSAATTSAPERSQHRAKEAPFNAFSRCGRLPKPAQDHRESPKGNTKAADMLSAAAVEQMKAIAITAHKTPRA